MPRRELDYVRQKLDWMRKKRIWPNGLRYLWTDAFGLVLYVSLFRETGDERWLDAAKDLVVDVDCILGRPRGYRIGEAPERDGQYFHYLAMWLFALACLGEHEHSYRERGIRIAKDIHEPFVLRGRGVIWKMEEDLSAAYPGCGLGAMDAFDGYVSYKLLSETELAVEIAEMRAIMERQYESLRIDQDLGLGMMLWLAHFFPTEDWAVAQREQSLAALDFLWVDPPGFFGRASYARDVRIAFANFGVSIGLQSQDMWPDRVQRLNDYFEGYRSGDEYDCEAITWVMACCSHFPGAFINVRADADAAPTQ
ncbi:MAG TPA: hypothetical protein VF776_01050 [Sphingomicrobium sp.]